MKIHKTKKVILTAVTTLVLLSTLPFIQSCSNEETPLSSNQEYLDVNATDIINLTYAQKVIFQKAKERIDPYVVCSNKIYSLTITEGSTIHISDQLFELMKKVIAKTNTEIKNLEVISDAKNKTVLHIISSKNLSQKVRFKTMAEVPDSGDWGVDARWYGVDLYLTNDQSKSLTVLLAGGAAVAGVAAYLTTAFPGVAFSAVVVAAITGYCSAVIGTYNEGQGVILECAVWGDIDCVSR
jgi:hypothetical protein